MQQPTITSRFPTQPRRICSSQRLHSWTPRLFKTIDWEAFDTVTQSEIQLSWPTFQHPLDESRASAPSTSAQNAIDPKCEQHLGLRVPTRGRLTSACSGSPLPQTDPRPPQNLFSTPRAGPKAATDSTLWDRSGPSSHHIQFDGPHSTVERPSD